MSSLFFFLSRKKKRIKRVEPTRTKELVENAQRGVQETSLASFILLDRRLPCWNFWTIFFLLKSWYIFLASTLDWVAAEIVGRHRWHGRDVARLTVTPARITRAPPKRIQLASSCPPCRLMKRWSIIQSRLVALAVNVQVFFCFSLFFTILFFCFTMVRQIQLIWDERAKKSPQCFTTIQSKLRSLKKKGEIYKSKTWRQNIKREGSSTQVIR